MVKIVFIDRSRLLILNRQFSNFSAKILKNPIPKGSRRIDGDGYYESVVLDLEGNRLELTV